MTRKPEMARKSQHELETLRSKYAQAMDINQALEKELAEKTKKHSDVESRLKDMAGYNRNGQGVDSSNQITPTRRKNLKGHHGT